MVARELPEASNVQVDGDRVVWRLHAEPPVTAQVQIGANDICLLAEADTGGGIAVLIEAQTSFQLEIDTGFTTFVEQVPAGHTRYLLTYLDRTDVRQL
jgi:hypothetical protein